MNLTVDQYFMGRDRAFLSECTSVIRTNAALTVAKINQVLDMAAADGVPLTGELSSGWRPLGINEHTQHAAEHSRHISAQAADVRDTPNRDLARWCCRNKARIEELGLCMERFEWTPTWCHFQTVPVPSGRLFFIPSSAPAMVEPLLEQHQYNC